MDFLLNKKYMVFLPGNVVIANPNIPIDSRFTTTRNLPLIFVANMRTPGFRKIEVAYDGYYKCSDGFYYAADWLLPAPVFKKGDKVRVVEKFPRDMKFGTTETMHSFCGKEVTIALVTYHSYAPDVVGEDGCKYCIEEDMRTYDWPSTAFVLNINLENQLRKDEDQLQKRRVAVSRGDKHPGSSICCRGCKAAITVGHLSHKEIFGI